MLGDFLFFMCCVFLRVHSIGFSSQVNSFADSLAKYAFPGSDNKTFAFSYKEVGAVVAAGELSHVSSF